MNIQIFDDASQLGVAAARQGAAAIRTAIAEKGFANIIVATGASQFETLAALIAESDIDWSCVTGFHLDEYLGISDQHPASFRLYLRERFVDKVPLKAFHYVDGSDPNPEQVCARLAELIAQHPIDVAFVGIGENGHLAFNDPPADFETDSPYLVVELDEACRKQQAGEGWFATLEDVPTRAISMSCQQILRTKTIICSVPDERKAIAVRNSVEGPVTPDVPASILQNHAETSLFLDKASASELTASSTL
ncbi:glucosamine-6-phosphate deaminase [Blastopirellula sp. JC732]|uniref:Glucosamine-6-phosphate deaminase n=1 Tax=Blastopirellula sediminis TaxID=2894196 RepID=A0A9X1MK08_9BACT|nr:glucosamine-6-phosphate deaminase [Blastopirellula sediminis]MCC9608670.1 glucosamine-6-phosphate deaminase [Blastopirellula sediminis]MCC9628553.1 glucosamine-6-phosphate deaminase [Blastopirellula sediminis]